MRGVVAWLSICLFVMVYLDHRAHQQQQTAAPEGEPLQQHQLPLTSSFHLSSREAEAFKPHLEDALKQGATELDHELREIKDATTMTTAPASPSGQ